MTVIVAVANAALTMGRGRKEVEGREKKKERSSGKQVEATRRRSEFRPIHLVNINNIGLRTADRGDEGVQR